MLRLGSSLIVGASPLIVIFVAHALFGSVADSTQQRRSETLSLHPDSSFSIIGMRISSDTLHIVAGSWDWDYPFGQFNDIAYLNKTQRNLSLTNRLVRVYTSDPLTHQIDSTQKELEWQISLGHSFVKFARDEEDSLYYIVYGKIRTDKIVLRSGAKVGMSEEHFLGMYFQDIPAGILTRVHVVEIVSPVVQTLHRYVFGDGVLRTIYLDRPDRIPVADKYSEF